MKRSATDPPGVVLQQPVDGGHRHRPVGQTGELVVRRRPLQRLGSAPLVGDILDVGDGHLHPVVLCDRDASAGPHVLPVATAEALFEEVRVGVLPADAIGSRPAQVVWMGELAYVAADEVVESLVEHLGERQVGVEDLAIAEADEGHPRRCRVERLLEAPPRLVEGPHSVLAFAHITKPKRQPVLVNRLLDDAVNTDLTAIGATDRELEGRGDGAAGVVLFEAAAQPGEHSVSVEVMDARHELSCEEPFLVASSHLPRHRVRRPDDPVAIDLYQRLGQLVEHLAELGLGADESIDGVLEVLPQSPRLSAGQHECGERDDTDAAGEQRAGDDGYDTCGGGSERSDR